MKEIYTFLNLTLDIIAVLLPKIPLFVIIILFPIVLIPIVRIYLILPLFIVHSSHCVIFILLHFDIRYRPFSPPRQSGPGDRLR